MSNQKYEKLIRAIELVNIELQDLKCHKNNNLSPEKRSKLQVGLKNEIVEQFHDGFNFVVYIHFDVIVFHQDETDEEESAIDESALFEIAFTLESMYKIDFSEVDHDIDEYEEELEIFSNNNVPINTWPYAREIVSNISTRMGFPPLFIPTNKNVPPL